VNRRGESGTALVEVTWLAVLLLVPLVYVVLAVFEVQRGAFGATAGARAAGRVFVLAPDPGSAATRARAAAALALRDQGIDPADVEVSLSCRPTCLAPGSTVHVDVEHRVPLPFLPVVLGDQAPSIRVSAKHTVPYGSFREDRS
jgi:hypothetical protein